MLLFSRGCYFMTRPGAHPSLPFRAEVDRVFAESRPLPGVAIFRIKYIQFFPVISP